MKYAKRTNTNSLNRVQIDEAFINLNEDEQRVYKERVAKLKERQRKKRNNRCKKVRAKALEDDGKRYKMKIIPGLCM